MRWGETFTGLCLLFGLWGASGQWADSSKTGRLLALAAEDLTLQEVRYDPSYFSIPYPMGDVPAEVGVCTDVLIRAYRKIGVDLQERIHLDMRTDFALYPSQRIWGLPKPDPNIDHRRVPNLMTFFRRQGAALHPGTRASDYQPGDVVTWDLGSGVGHIGIVSTRRSGDTQRLLIVHNIGSGQVLEDCLFRFPITGHFRYLPQD